MKAKRTFVLTGVVGTTLVLGLAAFLWLRAKQGPLTSLVTQDRTIAVWNAQDGKPMTQLAQNNGAVSSVTFSPDGQLLVTKSRGGTARIWDTRTGNLLTDPAKDSNIVSSTTVTSSPDSAVYVWEVQTGQPLAELPNHGGIVTSAWFTADGKQIITSSQDGSERVWEMKKPSSDTSGTSKQEH